jgi:hypothetical protein
MPDEACRLAQAEANIQNICRKFDAHALQEHEQLEEIRDAISKIQTSIESNKGFVRGVAFTISAVAGVVGWAFHQFFGNGNN